MPRQARKKSESGIYHVILRGTNRQEIFHIDQDRIRFLETVVRNKQEGKFHLYGWCLMGNHIHLLMEADAEELSVTMKRIGVSYVGYFNGKYHRTGHLFQDRFRSEPVETEPYLLTVIRYIHWNPVKAGLVRSPTDWPWSSCGAYYGKKESPAGLTECRRILGIFASDQGSAVRQFQLFNEQASEESGLDDGWSVGLSDAEAAKVVSTRVGREKLAGLLQLPRAERDDLLRAVKEIEGISQRQAARILGIPVNLVFKA